MFSACNWRAPDVCFDHSAHMNEQTADVTAPAVSRTLADTAIRFYFGRPSFGHYGSGFVSEKSNFDDGHLLTNNIMPQCLPNRPQSAQVFPHAVRAAKQRGNVSVESVSNWQSAFRRVRPVSAMLSLTHEASAKVPAAEDDFSQ
jgi:hypothetical protein